MNELLLPKGVDDFNQSLLLDSFGIYSVFKLYGELESQYSRRRKNESYGEEAIFLNIRECEEYFDAYFYANLYFYGLNRRIFEEKDIDCLDELLSVKSNKPEEKYIKFLTMLKLCQEFFGIIVASDWYTNSDFWNLIAGSSCKEKTFMNFHVIHFMLHRNFKLNGMFSLYDNSDLSDENKLSETRKFGSAIGSKLQSVIQSNYFDEYYKPFFGKWSEIESEPIENIAELIHESVSHGSHAENLIVKKINELLIEEAQ